MVRNPCRHLYVALAIGEILAIGRIEGRTADLFWVEAAGQQQPILGVLFQVGLDSLQDIRQ